MSGPRIQRFEDATSWNAFVREQAGWTHFHLYEWKHVIERVFGHECIYLAQSNAGNAIEGLLPLVRVKSRLFVFINWAWSYFTYDQSLRLMIRPKGKEEEEGERVRG